MKARAIIYTINNTTFLKVQGNKRYKPYSLKFLEKLCGFKLVDHAPDVLFQWGNIRVCENDPNSYRKLK